MSSWVDQCQPDLMGAPTAPELTPPLNEGPELLYRLVSHWL